MEWKVKNKNETTNSPLSMSWTESCKATISSGENWVMQPRRMSPGAGPGTLICLQPYPFALQDRCRARVNIPLSSGAASTTISSPQSPSPRTSSTLTSGPSSPSLSTPCGELPVRRPIPTENRHQTTLGLDESQKQSILWSDHSIPLGPGQVNCQIYKNSGEKPVIVPCFRVGYTKTVNEGFSPPGCSFSQSEP